MLWYDSINVTTVATKTRHMTVYIHMCKQTKMSQRARANLVVLSPLGQGPGLGGAVRWG